MGDVGADSCVPCNATGNVDESGGVMAKGASELLSANMVEVFALSAVSYGRKRADARWNWTESTWAAAVAAVLADAEAGMCTSELVALYTEERSASA